jgi:hypothetical protein
MDMNTRICSTKNFKKGDTVWFCNIEVTNSGRMKNNVKPILVTVSDVTNDWIKVDFSSTRCQWYGLLSTYQVDSELGVQEPGGYSYQNSIGVHFSKTKEEAEKKYNLMIEKEIERRFSNYKWFETVLRRQLL